MVSSSEVEFEVKGAPVVMVTVDVKECGAVLQVVGNITDLACICYLDNKEEGQDCELKLLISVFFCYEHDVVWMCMFSIQCHRV